MDIKYRCNGLTNFRESLDISPEKMANLLDISISYYYKIESGVRNPSYNFLSKFKDKFPHTVIDDIFFT